MASFKHFKASPSYHGSIVGTELGWGKIQLDVGKSVSTKGFCESGNKSV